MIQILYFDIYTVCSAPLGMESRKIKDSQIIASTETVANRAIYGRLHLRFHPIYHREIQSFLSGAWTASRNDVDQWIQVDLASYTKVTGVATQGRSFGNDWVTKYKLQYSNNGVRFYSYKAPGQRSAKVLITTTHVMFSSKQDCGGGVGGSGVETGRLFNLSILTFRYLIIKATF